VRSFQHERTGRCKPCRTASHRTRAHRECRTNPNLLARATSSCSIAERTRDAQRVPQGRRAESTRASSHERPQASPLRTNRTRSRPCAPCAPTNPTATRSKRTEPHRAERTRRPAPGLMSQCHERPRTVRRIRTNPSLIRPARCRAWGLPCPGRGFPRPWATMRPTRRSASGRLAAATDSHGPMDHANERLTANG
jgi:hypothetical protein